MKKLLLIIAILASAVSIRAQEEITGPKPYALYYWPYLYFFYDDMYYSRNGHTYMLSDQLWDNSLAYAVRRVEFDSSFADARPTSTCDWFAGMTNLEYISGISYLNTQSVINMSGMFCYNSILQIDLSNFDTRNVTDMSGMFSNSSFTSLDVSNFDTRNVTDMYGMFSGCSLLTNLDVSNFDTRNVTDMSWIFSGCSLLTNLDVSNFDTRNVTDMSGMFSNSSFTSLDVSNFDTRNVKDMSTMFGFCSSLTSLDLSSFNTQSVSNMFSMFWCCSSLTNLNLSNFDTNNVTDMSLMFAGCSSLTRLDLSSFDTNNVTNMRSMFGKVLYDEESWPEDTGCSSLTNLDLSSFNTHNVSNMSSMFAGCSSLTSLDLSNFDTNNVSTVSYMFWKCSALKSLDLSNFEIPKDNNHYFLYYCSGLDTLKISSSFNRLSWDACVGVGTKEEPCVIIAPDDFDFETDTSGDWFLWKGGYFKLEDSKRYVTLRVTTDLGYITYCSYEPLDFTNPWGVKAYIVTDYNDGVVTLSQMTTTPPKTGLLLKLGAGDYQFRFAQGGNEKDNMLKGVLWDTYINPTEGDYINFVLANGNNGLGFYRLKESGKLAAHRAYLQVPASAIANEAKFLKMRFDDEATAIDGIIIHEENVPYYDLQGNCYESKPTKQGIYIHNGKKVVVK